VHDPVLRIETGNRKIVSMPLRAAGMRIVLFRGVSARQGGWLQAFIAGEKPTSKKVK